MSCNSDCRRVRWSDGRENVVIAVMAVLVVVLAGVVLAETARTVGPGETPELPPG